MTAQERRLLELFRAMEGRDREAVLALAEFLGGRALPLAVLEPLVIPRPAQESVPAAMKRLRESYPMLDAARLLGEAAGLMSEHLLRGRAAVEVIDDLEALFERHYRQLRGGGALGE